MIDLNKTEINKKKIKIGIFSSIFTFLVLVGLMILIGFKVNDNNASLLRIISILLMIILGCLIVFFLCEFVYSKAVENKFLNKLKKSSCKNYVGKVLTISEPLTTHKFCKSLVIEIEIDNQKHSLYYDIDKGLCPLLINNTYSFEVRDKYIINYEER